MQYIDFDGHHYGFYLTYVDSKIRVVLVENKQKVCDITCYLGSARISSFNEGYGFVNLTKNPFLADILEAAKCKQTGRKLSVPDTEIVEYDFSPLIVFNNKEMKRHLMKKGMVQIGDGQFVSSSLIYYACHLKNPEKYVVVTTESITYKLQKKYFVAAIRDFNIPVYKRSRKEIY